jgi:hypothetical protein
MNKTICPSKQKPICEMCGIEVLAGHTLCKEHWKVRFEEQFKSVDYVALKETEFKQRLYK